MTKTKTIIVSVVVLATATAVALIYLRLNSVEPIAIVSANTMPALSPQTPHQVMVPTTQADQANQKSANEAPAPIPAAASTLSNVPDPRLDLNTAIQDIAKLLRSGDNVALRQNYTPPNELNPRIIASVQGVQSALAQHPEAQVIIKQMNEETAQVFEALETQTPTLNAAGDEATYAVPKSSHIGTGDNAMIPNTFIKIDGKWYLKWKNENSSE